MRTSQVLCNVCTALNGTSKGTNSQKISTYWLLWSKWTRALTFENLMQRRSSNRVRGWRCLYVSPHPCPGMCVSILVGHWSLRGRRVSHNFTILNLIFTISKNQMPHVVVVAQTAGLIHGFVYISKAHRRAKQKDNQRDRQSAHKDAHTQHALKCALCRYGGNCGAILRKWTASHITRIRRGWLQVYVT